jgi:hypothetical protein
VLANHAEQLPNYCTPRLPRAFHIRRQPAGCDADWAGPIVSPWTSCNRTSHQPIWLAFLCCLPAPATQHPPPTTVPISLLVAHGSVHYRTMHQSPIGSAPKPPVQRAYKRGFTSCPRPPCWLTCSFNIELAVVPYFSPFMWLPSTAPQGLDISSCTGPGAPPHLGTALGSSRTTSHRLEQCHTIATSPPVCSTRCHTPNFLNFGM